jgi:hypothetical protein
MTGFCGECDRVVRGASDLGYLDFRPRFLLAVEVTQLEISGCECFYARSDKLSAQLSHAATTTAQMCAGK